MASEHSYQDDDERGVIPYAPLQPARDTMVMPLADPAHARQAIEAYERLKTAIVRPDDQVTVKGKTFLKKSFWRRVATCFGLDVHLVSETRVVSESGVLSYSVIYRAVAPNGRSMDGDGYCDSAEFGPTEHNTRAKAHTRAKNRAISDLVGGGEVSADELTGTSGGEDTDDDTGGHVTQQQRVAIRKAYEALGRPMPRNVNPATADSANALLRQLRDEWRARQEQARYAASVTAAEQAENERQQATPATPATPDDLSALPVGQRGN